MADLVVVVEVAITRMDTARRQHRRYTTSMLLRISHMPGSNLKRTAALNRLIIPVIRRVNLIGLKARLMRQLPCLLILSIPPMLRSLILQPLTTHMSLPMERNNNMPSRTRHITRHLSGVVKDLPFRPPIVQEEAVAASMTAGPPRSAPVVVSSMISIISSHRTRPRTSMTRGQVTLPRSMAMQHPHLRRRRPRTMMDIKGVHLVGAEVAVTAAATGDAVVAIVAGDPTRKVAEMTTSRTHSTTRTMTTITPEEKRSVKQTPSA